MAEILKVELRTADTFAHLLDEIRTAGLTEKYNFSSISDPASSFADYFIDYILEHGFSSLLKSTMSMEEITSPSTKFDITIEIYRKFVRTLAPAKNIIIIDPYFYAGEPQDRTDVLLGKMIKPIIGTMEKLNVMSIPSKRPLKNLIHSKLKSLNPSLKITDHRCHDFHDRFWINTETQSGILMGTSLNSLRRRISLIDKLKPNDVNEILRLVRSKVNGISL